MFLALDELLGLVNVSVLIINYVLRLEGSTIPLILRIVSEVVLLQRVLLIKRILFVLNSLIGLVSLEELLLWSNCGVLSYFMLFALRNSIVESATIALASCCFWAIIRSLLDLRLDQRVHGSIFLSKLGLESKEICFKVIDALKVLRLHILWCLLSRSLFSNLVSNKTLQPLDLLGKFYNDPLKSSRILSSWALWALIMLKADVLLSARCARARVYDLNISVWVSVSEGIRSFLRSYRIFVEAILLHMWLYRLILLPVYRI